MTADPSYRQYCVQPGVMDFNRLELVALKRVAQSSYMPHFRLIGSLPGGRDALPNHHPQHLVSSSGPRTATDDHGSGCSEIEHTGTFVTWDDVYRKPVGN